MWVHISSLLSFIVIYTAKSWSWMSVDASRDVWRTISECPSILVSHLLNFFPSSWAISPNLVISYCSSVCSGRPERGPWFLTCINTHWTLSCWNRMRKSHKLLSPLKLGRNRGRGRTREPDWGGGGFKANRSCHVENRASGECYIESLTTAGSQQAPPPVRPQGALISSRPIVLV